MISEDSTCNAADEVSSAAASCSRLQRGRLAVYGVRHKFQNFMQWSGNKITIWCQSEHERILSHRKPSHLKKNHQIYETSLYGPANRIHTKSATSDMPSMQPTEHPRTSPPGSRVSEHMPLYPSCVHLPEWAVSQSIETDALEARKIMLERTRRIRQAH